MQLTCTTQEYFYLLNIYFLKFYSLRSIILLYFLKFFEFELKQIFLKLGYTNIIIFNMFWGLFCIFCTVLTFHYWNIKLMYFYVQLGNCSLMLTSFYMYSFPCTLVA